MRSWPALALLSEGISSIQSILSTYRDLISRKREGKKREKESKRARIRNYEGGTCPTVVLRLLSACWWHNILRAAKVTSYLRLFHPTYFVSILVKMKLRRSGIRKGRKKFGRRLSKVSYRSLMIEDFYANISFSPWNEILKLWNVEKKKNLN